MSLWPWKRDSTSPASFEKALSKLSTQITAQSVSLDTTRSRARRAKALWTLYTTLTYLLYTLILAIVLGPQKWGVAHYAGLLGAPVVIYAVRKGLTLFFDWRISKQTSYLTALQSQRETKINELKRATKYDSTQQLLDKYGGKPQSTPSKSPQQRTKRDITPSRSQGRTGIAPPPTANIPGKTAGSTPSTPRPPSVNTSPAGSSINARSPMSAAALMHSPAFTAADEPGFAPNAFTLPPTLVQNRQPQWYDRILDVLLGEDETLPRNRLALICSNCRVVNGQAPPGVKTLEEIGRWRCSSCGAWNGIENETIRMVKEIQDQEENDRREGWEKVTRSDEDQGNPESTPSVVDKGSTYNGDDAEDMKTEKPSVVPNRDGKGEVEVEADNDDETITVSPPSSTRSKRVAKSRSKPAAND